jgi:hypothetical protein
VFEALQSRGLLRCPQDCQQTGGYILIFWTKNFFFILDSFFVKTVGKEGTEEKGRDSREKEQRERMAAQRRLAKELADCKRSPLENMSLTLKGDNLFEWSATLIGPQDSPYAGGVFFLDVVFPEEYPFKAPKITFLTKVYHPNVASNGVITYCCFDKLIFQLLIFQLYCSTFVWTF